MRYLEADLFQWQPDQQYDFIFFSFWLSPVPDDKFDSFWQTVQRALKDEGQVFLIDSLFTQTATARDHVDLNHSGLVECKLNDGRTFQIVKIFYDPPTLEQRLTHLGWRGKVQTTEQYFLYGTLSC